MNGYSRTVAALAQLSIFSPQQSAAYREHSSAVSEVFGPDIPTKLTAYLRAFAESRGNYGLIILTGNAGTGKTAALEAFTTTQGATLPKIDVLSEVAARSYVIKDLSGIAESERSLTLQDAIKLSSDNRVVICANEGVLRKTIADTNDLEMLTLLDSALRTGADKNSKTTIINVNRQRPTSSTIWPALFRYLTDESLWYGCDNCPFEDGACTPRINASALRSASVQSGLRDLVRYASSATPATMREVVSLLAWAIVGTPGAEFALSCDKIKRRYGDFGTESYDATYTYYELALGNDLSSEALERSPLLGAIRRAKLGETSDLEVDEWLRDVTNAPPTIRSLAVPATNRDALSSRVSTSVGGMSFGKFGDTLSTSEDATKVSACLDALVDERNSALSMWRRRVYFEASDEFSNAGALVRLTALKFFPEMLAISARCGLKTLRNSSEIIALIRGLNMLSSAFKSASEGLIVPESSVLFARDPGAYVSPNSTMIHSYVGIQRVSLRSPDRGITREILDTDDIEFEFVVDERDDLVLTINPDLYEAIREAEAFAGPVGRGITFMAELREFYGRLSSMQQPTEQTRIATGEHGKPTLLSVRLPEVGS